MRDLTKTPNGLAHLVQSLRGLEDHHPHATEMIRRERDWVLHKAADMATKTNPTLIIEPEASALETYGGAVAAFAFAFALAMAVATICHLAS